MKPLHFLLRAGAWLLLNLLPGVLLLRWMERRAPRSQTQWRVGVVAIAGVVTAILAVAVSRVVLGAAGINPFAWPLSPMGFLSALVFMGPLMGAASVCVLWAAYRLEWLQDPYQGWYLGLTGAMTFGLAEGLIGTISCPSAKVFQSVLLPPAHVLCAAIWVHLLALSFRSRRPKDGFFVRWLLGCMLVGLSHVLAFGSLATALLGVGPMVLVGGVVFVAVDGELRSISSNVASLRRRRASLPPTSLGRLRRRLSLQNRGLRPFHIAGTTLAHQGTLFLATALALGFNHKLGLRLGEGSLLGSSWRESGWVPLALGFLGSFPLSGLMASRGTEDPTVVESLLAHGLSLTMIAISLGWLSPSWIAFVVVCAPFALGFAGVGAWLGAGR